MSTKRERSNHTSDKPGRSKQKTDGQNQTRPRSTAAKARKFDQDSGKVERRHT